MRALRDAGATALELGYPFSDPIADGPVLAAAADRALGDGTDWSDLVRSVRTASPVLPTAVMTYANPVVRHGLVRALAELASAGASGLIVPDLSLEESLPWQRASQRVGLSLVLMAAPGASADRAARIARASRGFLYLVAYYGTTGRASEGPAADLGPIVTAVRRAAPDRPILLGFGVRDRRSAERALALGVDGVVVGTALEEAIARDPSPRALGDWLREIAAARRAPAVG